MLPGCNVQGQRLRARGAGVPGCRGAGVPGCRDAGMPGCRGSVHVCFVSRRHIIFNERGKAKRRMLIIQVSSPPSALFLNNVLEREIPPATQATKAVGIGPERGRRSFFIGTQTFRQFATSVITRNSNISRQK